MACVLHGSDGYQFELWQSQLNLIGLSRSGHGTEVKIAQMFSFNLNFFAPECSAETPYITKWIGYLATWHCDAVGSSPVFGEVGEFITGTSYAGYD